MVAGHLSQELCGWRNSLKRCTLGVGEVADVAECHHSGAARLTTAHSDDGDPSFQRMATTRTGMATRVT